MNNLFKSILKKNELKEIADAIKEVENTTSGEIRVSIRCKRRWGERKLALEDIAKKEFVNLKMNNTRDKTGVLIFLLLQDKSFYILADDGIHKKVNQSVWNAIALEMTKDFISHNFKQGIITAINSVGKILSENFPKKLDDRNELTNEVKVS